MKISIVLKFIGSIGLFVGLLSCASTQQFNSEESTIKSPPKLLFLNYEIKKINNKKTVSLINQITTDGALKIKSPVDAKGSTGDLECLILDEDFNLLEKHHIKNPLKKFVEFVNESGQFEKKILDLDRSEFSLKLQFKSNAKFVVINEITETETIKHSTIKIE